MSMSIKSRSSIKEGGGTIWDAAYVIIHFIMKNPDGFKACFNMSEDMPYKVVELGSGTGIAGIAFAKMFSKSEVYLTEMSEDSLKLMRENVEANGL